jgi:hypothetical protein
LIIYTLQTDAAEFKTEFESAQKINAGGAVEQPKVEEAKAEEVKTEEPTSTAEDPADKDKPAEKAAEVVEEKGDQEGKEAAEAKE